MKILFAEDEQSKERHVMSFLNQFFLEDTIDVVKSLMQGIRVINDTEYDLVLLDMSLPLFDFGGEVDDINEFEAFAGMDLLDEMNRIEYDSKVIVITAFDVIEDDVKRLTLEQLNEQMEREFSDLYIGCIQYNSSSLQWEENLVEILKSEGII